MGDDGGAVAAERIGEREAELEKGAIGGSKTRAIGGKGFTVRTPSSLQSLSFFTQATRETHHHAGPVGKEGLPVIHWSMKQ